MNQAQVAAYVGSSLGQALALAERVEKSTGAPTATFMETVIAQLDGIGLQTSSLGSRLGVSSEGPSGMASTAFNLQNSSAVVRS